MNLEGKFIGVDRVRGHGPDKAYIPVEAELEFGGPWYVLLRAHNQIWNDKHWPFWTRYEASRMLWDLDSTFFERAA
jgi:hypothetical protein